MSTPFMGGADALRLLNAPQQTSPQQLLRQLSAGGSFQSILDKARAGAVSSGIAVTTAKDCPITLTQDQLTRLAAAADIAEANGAGRAVFLVDGQALRMDVGTRTILGPVDLSSTAVLSDIDAVVAVAASDAVKKQASAPFTAPSNIGTNASLLRTLAERA